jgi:hypothetical protein
MKRLVVFGLLLTFAACAPQPPPPPAATAPPPQVAAAPPPAMPAPAPAPPSHTSFDGLYKGTMTAQAFGGGTQELTGGNCNPDAPINMRVKRGTVRIWYKNFAGHTLHSRGRIDATGKIETGHTNAGGNQSIFALQVSGDQATGNMERGRCWYGVTMTRA